MTKTTRIILIVSVLVLLYGILFGCKSKDEKYGPPTYLKKWDSVQMEFERWVDTANVSDADSFLFTEAPTFTLDTVTTYVFEGEYDHPIGKVKHTIPIKYGQLRLRGDPPSYDHNYISIIIDTAFFGRLQYHPFVGEPNGCDTLPIHWTSDSTQAYFLLEDIQSDYFSISDSIETVAVRDNKTRKWEITDCQRALEVMYMLDSIRNADYDVEYIPKKKK